VSATETKPSETPQVRRGVALPRVHGAPPDDRFAPGVADAPAPAPGRARRRLVLVGGLAGVAVVTGVLTFPQFRSAPRTTPANAPVALDPAPPAPKWATSVPPVKKSPRAHPARRTAAATASATPRRSAAPRWRTLVVRATYVLQPGASVRTNRISLGLTTRGELLLRDEHGRVTWSSGTRAAGTRAVFQADGNFVVYQGEQTLWSSRTDGHAGATLVLRADGRVAIVWKGATLWRAGGS
jgi:hypothetical protein